MLFNYNLFNLNNEIKYGALKFYFFFLLLFHPAAKRKESEGGKNHSRQNANEPGSYYDANEIPP